MSADTPAQVAGLRAAGALVRTIIDALAATAKPGVTTAELDALAAAILAEHDARSGPIITYRYPGSICLSVDDEIVHGIPGDRLLQDGQLLTIDVALELDGYHADAATTIAIGTAKPSDARLMAAAKAALHAGIHAAKPGATLQDVGAAVERVTETRGFRVVRELTGHGIGRAMHEEPTVYNWPAPTASGDRLTPGLVFTIEPMIVAGDPAIALLDDGWTMSTIDGSRSAHEEHTIMVAHGDAIVLTA
jgi:methionyl aminopeptidase